MDNQSAPPEETPDELMSDVVDIHQASSERSVYRVVLPAEVLGQRRVKTPKKRITAVCPRVYMWFEGGVLLTAILDSGASHSVMRHSLAEKLGLGLCESPIKWIKGVGISARSTVLGITTAELMIGSRKGLVEFLVVPDDVIKDTLLGVEVCHSWELAFGKNAKDGTPTLWLAGQQCYRLRDSAEEGPVYTSQLFKLPPESGDDSSDDDLPMVNRRDEATSEMLPDSHFVDHNAGTLPTVRLRLTSDGTELQIVDGKRGDSLKPDGVEEAGFVNAAQARDDEQPPDPSVVGGPEHELLDALSESDRTTLLAVQTGLASLSQVAVTGVEVPEEFWFDVKLHPEFEGKRLVEAQRQHGEANSSLFKAWVAENDGKLIEQVPPGQTIEYCSNHCFPPAPSGGKRVSYVGAKLNPATVPDAVFRFSTRGTMEGLDPATTVYSVLDIRWAFNLVPIKEEARKYCTFYGPDGTYYRYKRMSFGFKNAPAAFHRWLSHVFAPLAKFVKVFVDDVLVFSKNPAEHVEHLRQVQELLKKYSIPVRWQKLKLFRTVVDYLGARIGPGNTIVPNSKSLQTLDEMPAPTDAKEVLRFVGLARWLAPYIENLEKHLTVLQQLTKKNTAWRWTQVEIDAFEATKAAARKHFTNSIIDPNGGDLGLYTDASNWGVGAVLCQGGVPVSLFSYAFTGTQLAWSTHSQEVYAIIKSVGHFWSQLAGRHFTLYTDHRPIIWLVERVQNKENSAMNWRWLNTLQGMDFTIFYLPGEKNTAADALSRSPFIKPSLEATAAMAARSALELDRKAVKESDGPDTMGVRFLTTDEADETLDGLYLAALKWIEGNIHPQEVGDDDPDAQWRDMLLPHWDELYRERDRICHQGEKDNDFEPSKIFVPASAQKDLWEELHASPFGGHVGRDAMLARFTERYWWPTMREDITRWCSECDSCQRSKPGFDAAKKMHPLPTVRTWERVHVDLMDMTKNPSAEDHRYILLVRDAGSRYTALKPLHTKSAADVAKKLIKVFGFLGGTPMNVVSDQGSEFVNELLDEMFTLTRVAHRVTAVDHHISNGMAERTCRSVHQYFRLFNAKDRWNEFLPAAAFAMNSTVNATTRYSPFKLMLGREAMFPTDVQRLLQHKYPALTDSEHWDATFVIPREQALENIDLGKERLRKRVASKVGSKLRELIVGDYVMRRNLDTSAGRKNRDIWVGKHLVLSRALDGNTTIQMEHGVTKTFPEKQLRLYVEAKKVRFNVDDDDDDVDEELPVVPTPPPPPPPASLEPPPKRSRGKKKKNPPPTVSNGEFVIESILGARGTIGVDREYRVRWQGYTSEHNTWEPTGGLHLDMQADCAKRWPKPLSKTVLSYTPDLDEISSVLRVVRRKKTQTRSATQLLVVELFDDPSTDECLLDLEHLPPALFQCKRLWTNDELFRLAVKTFQPE